jgi:hypothetical protein
LSQRYSFISTEIQLHLYRDIASSRLYSSSRIEEDSKRQRAGPSGHLGGGEGKGLHLDGEENETVRMGGEGWGRRRREGGGTLAAAAAERRWRRTTTTAASMATLAAARRPIHAGEADSGDHPAGRTDTDTWPLSSQPGPD